MKTPSVGLRLSVVATIVIAGVASTATATATAAAVSAAPAIGPSAGAGPGRAEGNPDVQARDLFQSGGYAAALAIYQRLHTETHHPTYLRNIGRCHQMLRAPAPAIVAFRGYLRDSRDLGQAERTEIEGYIAQMQRLEAGAPASPSLAAPTPSPGSQAALGLSTAGTTAAAPGAEVRPITRRWWFWTGLGALAVTAGIVAAVMAGSGGQDRLSCPAGAVCPP